LPNLNIINQDQDHHNKMSNINKSKIDEPEVAKPVNRKLPSNKMTNGQAYPGSKTRPTKATVL
jgi:hypothetical protein